MRRKLPSKHRARNWAVWVAHASRVLVSASRRNDLLLSAVAPNLFEPQEKFAIARTQSPARETRALPRNAAFTLSCHSERLVIPREVEESLAHAIQCACDPGRARIYLIRGEKVMLDYDLARRNEDLESSGQAQQRPISACLYVPANAT